MKALHLTLTKKWFDMILSGEKIEEYREIKPYWTKRLENEDGTLNRPNVIRFTNGYGHDKPAFEIECTWLRIGKGQPGWGANPDNRYYVLHLGDILATYNLNPTN